MRNIFILIGSLIVLSLNAQDKEWLGQVQHSTKINIGELGDISNVKWAKHLERYRWKESNCLDENGMLIPQNTRIKTFLDKPQNRSVQAFGNWTPIGLESWTNGNSGYNPGNGRINAVTVDPNNPQIIFSCASSGGVWKSNDGGNTWNTNTDNFPVLGTSDVAIDPNNSDIVYLATGDRDGLDTYGVGVYKSINGGSTWEPSGLFNNYDSEALIINALEIDHQQSNIIFAGSKDGLYKSIDFGENWHKVIESGSIMEIKINPENSNTVFAVSTSYFYRSHDGGENFEIISNGLQTSIGRIAMDITPADTSYIYLLIADGGSNFNGVFRSTDGGSSFTKEVGIDDINLLGYYQDGSDDASQAWYDLAIAVSETDKNRIYTGGINVWTSGDGGSSWNPSTEWSYNGDNTYAHADIHSLDFYGSTLYCGSDGGTFKKIDNSVWENLSFGLNISQIYKFSNTLDGTRTTIGCQDNGTNLSVNGDWTHIKGADGMATVIDQSNPSKVYLSWQYGGFAKSTTGGDNNYSMFSPSDYGEEGIWVTPIAISKSQPATLMIGLENIFRSNNSGSSWSSISNFSDGENFKVVAIAPSDPNYIYAAKDNHLYYTWDGGNNWSESANPYVEPITDIAISETDPLNVYFLKSSSYTKVYHSTDGGQTFATIQSSITQTTSSAIVLENNTDNGIYIGTEFGVYYTNDLLGEWIFYSDQLPNVKVTDLEIVNNKLRAATYGRGVWESDLFSSSVDIKNSSAYQNIKIYPNPTNGAIYINTDHLNIDKIQIFNTSGILVREYSTEQVSYNISNLVSGTYFIRIQTLDSGIFVKHLIKQ